MSNGNNAIKTLAVAGSLCLVCSIIVSSLVVELRPMQQKNAELDMKKNVLLSAGLIEEGAKAETIEKTFSEMETVIVDISTGEKVEVDSKEFNQIEASKDPKESIQIPPSLDVSNLGQRSKYAKVYLKRDESGKVQTVILNHWGKGLWSTMYGFIALEDDANTIKGFSYYSHGETPGLGGEVDNPSWKKQWIGKKIYDESGDVDFNVAKAQAVGEYQVDGLSGATITAVGVTKSIKYWFGENGYDDLLKNVRSGEI